MVGGEQEEDKGCFFFLCLFVLPLDWDYLWWLEERRGELRRSADADVSHLRNCTSWSSSTVAPLALLVFILPFPSPPSSPGFRKRPQNLRSKRKGGREIPDPCVLQQEHIFRFIIPPFPSLCFALSVFTVRYHHRQCRHSLLTPSLPCPSFLSDV